MAMSPMTKNLWLLAFVAFVVFLVFHVSNTINRPSWPATPDGWLNRAGESPVTRDEDDGGDQGKKATLEEAGEEEEAEAEVLSDDVTFLFAIINMNRTAHLGIENYTFEKDYLEQLKSILRRYKPEKLQIILQKKYYDHIKEHLYEGVHVRFVEIDELRGWEHYESIERIRKSDWWVPATPWLAQVPQGYSDLYNPIVMHKLLWLRDLSVLNPFKTRYFVWLDSGGICTPRIHPDHSMPISKFKEKAKNYMDKFFVSVTPYAMSHELHGCYRAAMQKLTHDVPPCFITKGWVMGGQTEYLVKVAKLYNYILNKTLDYGCLGTEETLLTMAYYRRPDLFHVHHNLLDRDDPFGQGGDVCHVIWGHEPAQAKVKTLGEKYLNI